MTAPNSKAKRSPAARLKRKIANKFRGKRETFPHMDAALAPPRVRLADAEIESFQVACVDEMHPIHFIRQGHALKAIITPCGIASSRAAWNLGADTCYKIVALAQGMVGDKPVMPAAQLPVNREGLIDSTGVVLRAVGDSAALQYHKALRIERLKRRRDMVTDPQTRVGKQGFVWDRAELTRLALPKLIARAAGEGAEVAIDGRRVYIHLPGHEVPSCCVYDTGSWGVGPGPQAPDGIYRALKRWAKTIEQHSQVRGTRDAYLTTPGYRPARSF